MQRNNTFNYVFIFLVIIFCAIFILTMLLLQSSTVLSKNIDNIEPTSCQVKNGSNFYLSSTKIPTPKISSFKTSFTTSGESRSHNINLATSHFNWLTIPSGGCISFNSIVGKRTKENGYRTGLVILNGKYVPGIGGGVCQVSSTLYNAWIRAGLSVKEVKAHTLPTSYCQLAQDATVSDWIDLVLCNDTDQDVVLNGYTDQRNIIFDIYGKKSDYDIQIISRIVKILPPPIPEIEFVNKFDTASKVFEGKFGKYVIITIEKNGYCAQSFIQYLKGNSLIEEKLLRTEYYIPIQGRILMEKGLDEISLD